MLNLLNDRYLHRYLHFPFHSNLQEYFKRCRKYHGIMTGITQDIEDLLITPEGRGIFNNSGFVAMLSQSNIGRREIQEQYDVSDSLIDYIKDKDSKLSCHIRCIFTKQFRIFF